MLEYINERITRKIFFALALLIISSLLVGFLSLWSAQKNKQRLLNMFQQEVVGLEEADDIKSALYRIRSDSLEYILAERKTTRSRLRKEINEQEVRLNSHLNRLEEIGLNEQEKKFVTDIRLYSTQYISLLENTFYQSVKRGDFTQAEKIARNKAADKLRLARTAANDFMDYSVRRAKNRKTNMEAEYKTFMELILIAYLAIVIISFLILVFFQRNIAHPITQMTRIMKRLGQRDWSVVIPATNRVDEVGEMAAAIKIFKENGVENERLAAVEIVKEKAEAKLAVQSTFISNMNHELRTPMTAVLGYSEILQENIKDPLTEQQQIYVGNIFDKAKKLMELIEQVMMLENMDEIKAGLTKELVQVDELCSQCLQLIEHEVQVHNLTIKRKLNSGCQIQTDEAYLRLVIYNLLSNAVKYNNDGGTILLECNEVDEDKIRISVTDTGDGIIKVARDKIFEPFNRLGKEGSNILGAGVGLTIVKHLTKTMGGVVDVVSKKGVGSTFWVELTKK